MTTFHLFSSCAGLLFARRIQDNPFDALVLSPLIILGVYRAVGHQLEASKHLLSSLVRVLSRRLALPGDQSGVLLATKRSPLQAGRQ